MDDLRGRHLHFVGVGGAGMRGLAAVCARRGASVSGSDLAPGPDLDGLRGAGAAIHHGHHEDHLPEVDAVVTVVRSVAVPDHNPEVAMARARGWPVLKYAELLGRVMDHLRGVAVAGTHGKTTTTAMLAVILDRAGLSPSFVAGGDIPDLGGSSAAGDGDAFVAEACEYDRSFLHLRPAAAAVLNVEEDHLDYYRDLEEITGAFAEFAARLPDDGLLVVGPSPLAGLAAQAAGCPVEAAGCRPGADWYAARRRPGDGRQSFVLEGPRMEPTEIHLRVPGAHNVDNAAAAAALATWMGASGDDVRAGLESFSGVRRRFQVVGSAAGMTVVDDYAHHPSEIAVTLEAAREHFPGRRLCVVFQPHQHSRTRFLLSDFARVLGGADRVIVPDIYFVRDSDDERRGVSSADLTAAVAAEGGTAEHVSDLDHVAPQAWEALREEAAGWVVLTLGAGNVDRVARDLLSLARADAEAPPLREGT